jgi:hypothetical protein
MSRNIVLLIALLWVLAGILISSLPLVFYEVTPGMKLMGAFNDHFIRDVGLAFIASGLCAMYGGIKHKIDLILAGALWPLLHAIFHAYIWIHRGMPFDDIFTFDLIAVVAPAVIVFSLGSKWSFHKK